MLSGLQNLARSATVKNDISIKFKWRRWQPGLGLNRCRNWKNMYDGNVVELRFFTLPPHTSSHLQFLSTVSLLLPLKWEDIMCFVLISTLPTEKVCEKRANVYEYETFMLFLSLYLRNFLSACVVFVFDVEEFLNRPEIFLKNLSRHANRIRDNLTFNDHTER